MMKRPDFDSFREVFLHCLSKITGQEPSLLAGSRWTDVADVEVRAGVLEAVKENVRDSHGVEFEVNQRLLTVDGPVESAVIQTFHELNTIHLMERINRKIRNRMN